MITTVRAGIGYPIELGLLIACVIAGAAGLALGANAPATAQHVGPPFLFFGLVLAGGVLGLGGILAAKGFRRRAPQRALWGVYCERAAVMLVGTEWVAYGLVLLGVNGLRGVPVAMLLVGIGGGCLGRAWQITRDLRAARIMVARRAGGAG